MGRFRTASLAATTSLLLLLYDTLYLQGIEGPVQQTYNRNNGKKITTLYRNTQRAHRNPA